MVPYYITALVNLLGPAKNVRARGKLFSNQREYLVGPKKGKLFDVEIERTTGHVLYGTPIID